MSIQINELRPDDLAEVQALFVDPPLAQGPAFPLGLSLVARLEGKIVAAIVCTRDADGYFCRMAHASGPHSADVEKTLVSRAMSKLNSNQIRKCRIAMNEGFFTAARWQAGDAAPPADARLAG